MLEVKMGGGKDEHNMHGDADKGLFSSHGHYPPGQYSPAPGAYPPQQGYPPAGYPPQQGYPPAGYPPQQGYPPAGYPGPSAPQHSGVRCSGYTDTYKDIRCGNQLHCGKFC
ncbi:hypothetical protein LIER_05889 [Lithospermum erythrorhizon]|uniref:Rhodopsin n=1 Tax=Lithospermum erythrorhizon TaxID=34254 RepID=A0AAV3P2E5_LITER